MGNARIAGRYAKSLLDLCIEKNQLDNTAADMQCLHQAFTESRELRNLLSSPVVKSDAKSAVLEKVFGKSLSPFTMAFIRLLTDKRREHYLGEVAESFHRQLLAYRGIVRAEVVSAVKLDEQTRAKLLQQATLIAGCNVELTERIDAELLGGFRLKVGDRLIDGAVSSSLSQLRRNFEDNPYVADF